MNTLNTFISKFKFKKIIIAYMIAAVIAVIGCAVSIGVVFKDSLTFAWQYSKVSETVEDADIQSIQTELNKLAFSSSDLIDVLILNSENKVIYSAKNSEFGSGQFILSRSGDKKNYLAYDKNSNVLFKYVNGDEFMLSSVFNHDFGEIKNEYNDESFFENNFSEKTVYMLSYIGGKNNENKIYIISNPSTVAGGELTIKIVASVVMLFFMVYWVLLALWVYQNAMKAKLRPLFWGIVVLITNIAGVLVYLLYKNGNVTCPSCGTSQSKSHKFCTNCGSTIGKCCNQCGTHIAKNDLFCPGCGKKSN